MTTRRGWFELFWPAVAALIGVAIVATGLRRESPQELRRHHVRGAQYSGLVQR